MKNSARRTTGILTAALALVPGTLLGYDQETHRGITLTALHRPECLVDAYLKKALLTVGGLKTNYAGTTLESYAGQGAVDEDDGVTSLNHFYNPLTGKGLFNGLARESALKWAWSGANNLPDTNHLSWQDARENYYQWLTTGSVYAQVNTFKALGHVVHLLQDMAQPQHTRDDAHGPPSVFGIDTGINSPYEIYCDRYSTEAQIAPLIQGFKGRKGLPQLDPRHVPGPHDGLGEETIPKAFEAFWNTGQYDGTAPPSSDLANNLKLGLAEYSNGFFVTNRTMFTGDFLGGRYRFPSGLEARLQPYSSDDYHWFPYPRLADTNFGKLGSVYPAVLNPGVDLDRQGQNISLSGAASRYRHWRLAGDADGAENDLFTSYTPANRPTATQIGLNFDDYKAHAQKLIPRAAFYSAGLLNYFFRGRISVARTYDESKKAYFLSVANPGKDVKFKEGTWEIVQSDLPDNTGLRRKLPVTSNYRGSLAPGETFSLSFPASSLTGHGPLTVVFHGTLGDVDAQTGEELGTEQDVAVVAQTFNIARLRLTWSPSLFPGSGSEVLLSVRGGPQNQIDEFASADYLSQQKGPLNYTLNFDYYTEAQYFTNGDPAGRYQFTLDYFGPGVTFQIPLTVTVETYLNSALPIRIVKRPLPTTKNPSQVASPPPGLSEGPYPSAGPPSCWYVTQIINLQKDGFVGIGNR